MPPPFDLLRDFEPIALIECNPLLIVSRKDLPAENLKESVAYIKVRAGKVTRNQDAGPPSLRAEPRCDSRPISIRKISDRALAGTRSAKSPFIYGAEKSARIN
jgi:Tripartite tricarboxylate transporter family receptor